MNVTDNLSQAKPIAARVLNDTYYGVLYEDVTPGDAVVYHFVFAVYGVNIGTPLLLVTCESSDASEGHWMICIVGERGHTNRGRLSGKKDWGGFLKEAIRVANEALAISRHDAFMWDGDEHYNWSLYLPTWERLGILQQYQQGGVGMTRLPGLILALRHDPDDNVRATAAEALGNVRSPAVVDLLLDPLLDALENGGTILEDRAATALENVTGHSFWTGKKNAGKWRQWLKENWKSNK